MNIAESRLQAISQFIKDNRLENRTPEIGKGIYMSYPDFFYKSIFCKEIDFNDERLTQFSLASYLMYQFLIDVDDVFDNSGGVLIAEKLSNEIGKQNLSHHLLAGIFDFDSEFWNLYNQRQSHFIDCHIFEATIIDYKYKHQHYKKKLELEFYRSYYKKKCSFSSLVIDGLYILNNKQCGVETYNKILNINDRFNFAFCILDDVEDYRKDIGKNQLNFAHHYFISNGNQANESIDEVLNNSIESFYTEGVSLQVMELAHEELLKAFEISKALGRDENLGILLQLKINDLNAKMNIVREYAK